MSDPRVPRLVKTVLHELFEHWRYFQEPLAASSFQQRFGTEVHRIFGPEFSTSRFMAWLEEHELIVVVRKRTGGRFLMPFALWSEFTEDDRSKIRAMVQGMNSDPSKLKTPA